MKLRNKKTGEIGELHYYPDKAYHFAVSAKDPTHTGIYKTLGEILQDWTDSIVHKPTEPLIKNEKMRKALRYWAEANNIKHVIVFDSNNASPYVHARNVEFVENAGHLKIVFRTEERFDTNRIYTIEELCGEE